MTLQIIFGSLFFITGILSSVLGLIFFIGLHKVSSQIVSACLMGAVGIIFLILGVALFRRVRFRKELQRLGGVKIVIEKCPYCGNDYPVRDDIERCPTCGGDLKLHRTALARNEKKFSMDGEDDTGIS